MPGESSINGLFTGIATATRKRLEADNLSDMITAGCVRHKHGDKSKDAW